MRSLLTFRVILFCFHDLHGYLCSHRKPEYLVGRSKFLGHLVCCDKWGEVCMKLENKNGSYSGGGYRFLFISSHDCYSV